MGKAATDSSVCERVSAIIREEIVAGTFTPGMRLPTVRELSRLHGASPVSVMQAIDRLAQQGYLDRKQRQGVRVTARDCWQVHLKHLAIAIGVASNLTSGLMRSRRSLAGMLHAESLLERAGCRVSFHGCVSYPYGDGLRRAWIPPRQLPGLGQADALIAAGVYEANYLGSLRELGLPVVVYDLDATSMRCDSVCVDDTGSGFALTELLIQSGFRDIAFLGSALNISDRQRLWNYDPCLLLRADGYRLAMRAHGLAEHLYFAEAGKPVDAVVAAARQALPDCRAFVVNGPGAKACEAIPGVTIARWADIGDTEGWAVDEFIAGIDFARMGEEAVRLVEARLSDRTTPIRRSLIWPTFSLRRGGSLVAGAAARWNRTTNPARSSNAAISTVCTAT